jgi:glycosyltransferase 2 family protein
VNILDWKKLLGAGIAIGLLYLSFHNVDFRELWHSLTRIHPVYLIGAAASAVAMNWAKGMRWRALIRDVKVISKPRAFALFHIGQMINLSIPMLGGQAGRIVMLARQERLSKTFCFTTVAMEVLCDAVSLVVLIYLASFLFAIPSLVREVEVYAAIGVGLMILILVLIMRYERGLAYFGKKTIRRRFPRLYKKLEKWTTSMKQGIAAVRSSRGVLTLGFYTLLVWLCHIGICVMLINAFGLKAPFWAAAVIVIVNSFLLLIPISPGNLGSFQFTVITALSFFDVSHAEAAAFSIVMHFMDYAPVFSVGFILLITNKFSFKKLREETVREVQQSDCSN